MWQKITKYLLIALTLSLGFGQVLRTSIRGIPVYPHDILIAIIILINAPNLAKKFKETYRVPRYMWWIAVGIMTGWIRAVSMYPLYTLAIPMLYAVRVFVYICLFYVLRICRITMSNTYVYMAGTITIIIGYLQYFFMPDMRWAQYLGWDDHLYRLTLPHFDPTYTGILLSLYALYCVAHLPKRHRVLIASAVGAILLTYSRSVWIALTLTGIAHIRNKKILIAGLALLAVSFVLLPKKFGEGTNLMRTFSIASRLHSDRELVDKVKYDLVWGQGLNTFARPEVSNRLRPTHATGPNNSYLYIVATMGIVGLMGWIGLYRDIYANSENKSALLFILIAGLFNNVLFYPFVMVFVILSETIFKVPSEV